MKHKHETRVVAHGTATLTMANNVKVPIADCVLTATINYVNNAGPGEEPVWEQANPLVILSAEDCANRDQIDVQGLVPFSIENVRGRGVITSVLPDFELKVFGELTNA